MKVGGHHFRTIWVQKNSTQVKVIDQTKLPFAFEILTIDTPMQMAHAIQSMQVRGAPLIGAAAAYGMALASLQASHDAHFVHAADMLKTSRPTAVNLAWAVERMLGVLLAMPLEARLEAAWREAAMIADEDVAQNQAIGQHGLALIKQHDQNKTLNIMTHCNAGWLATVDYGTALAPIYAAYDTGIDIHVWVSETRPRNQGASLTAWELAQHGVPHTVIADNAAGYLMQQGQLNKNHVDMVIVGADRVTQAGDVCNKIGTYLKALAARYNGVPFYAAVPSPTIDWQIAVADIEIEARSGQEITHIPGVDKDGQVHSVRIMPAESAAFNPAFDVTPADLVTGIITEKGVFVPQRLQELQDE
jgi:methylthioribose-1-phosphate isomerase